MSGETTSRDIEFTCPQCKGLNTITLWPRIDAESAPELMDMLYAGTLFDHVCGHCDETSSLDHTVLVEFGAAKTAILNLPPNDPLADTVNPADPAWSLYRLRKVTDSNALRDLALALRDELDDSAMLLLKHMLAARVMQDRGEPPVLCNYDAFIHDGSCELLEYVLFQTEESEPETLTGPMSFYDEVLQSVRSFQESIFPLGQWVDWSDNTAQQLWECVQQKVAVQ